MSLCGTSCPLTWLYYMKGDLLTQAQTCYGDFGAINLGCIIEGGLLTQVQTHAMETLGPINLAVIKRWSANTDKHRLWRLWGPLTWLYYRGVACLTVVTKLPSSIGIQFCTAQMCIHLTLHLNCTVVPFPPKLNYIHTLTAGGEYIQRPMNNNYHCHVVLWLLS